MCELLVQYKADVNVEDKYGQNCLYYAIREGQESIVDFLIKQVIEFIRELI